MEGLSTLDLVGYAAGLMTLITFAQTRMMLMRTSAISANLLFIGYGVLGGFYPVAVLHVALLPINLARLKEHWRRGRKKSRPPFGDPPLVEQWQRASRS